MKRFYIFTVLLAAVLLLASACAKNSVSQERQNSEPAATSQEQFDERKGSGPNEDLHGGPEGGRGNPGGMSQSSEPDEEL